MAAGDLVLSNHGSFSLTGAALKTAVDAISIDKKVLSGASVQIIPIGYGQVQLLELNLA